MYRHPRQGSVPFARLRVQRQQKRFNLASRAWSVRLGLIPLFDRTAAVIRGSNFHWLRNVLEQEGDGSYYVILENSKKLNFPLRDEANESIRTGDFHQPRLPFRVT